MGEEGVEDLGGLVSWVGVLGGLWGVAVVAMSLVAISLSGPSGYPSLVGSLRCQSA